jgi:hypothetical protein
VCAVVSPGDGACYCGSYEAGAQTCGPQWTPVDVSRGCLLPAKTAEGLCVGPSATKGLYFICAISPQHEFFYVGVTKNEVQSAPGWMFAPADTSEVFLGLPGAPALDDQLCAKLISRPLSPCGDAGAADASTD